MKISKFKPFVFCLALTLLICGIRIHDPYLVESVRLKGLDYYQRQGEPVISDSLAVIEIDEHSLEKNGQWPWSRDVIASGIVKAYENNAALVVIPIIFAEEDRMGQDEALLNVMQNYPVVTSQSAALNGKGTIVPRGVITVGEGLHNWLFEYPNGIGPTEDIGKLSQGVGMLLTAPESDGVVRRLPLIIQVKGDTYPTLPLEVLRLFSGEPSYQVKVDAAGVETVRIPELASIDTDQHSRVWVNFDYKFDKVSFADDDWSSLEGKIVFLGLTAEGLANSVATPINVSNGHELNMQVLQMILDDNTLTRPIEAFMHELAVTFGLCLFFICLALFLNYYINLILIVGVMIGIPYAGIYLFDTYNLLYDFTFPIYTIFIIFTASIFARFINEFKGRMLIKKQFEHYLAPEIVKKLQRNPSMLKLGGDTQDLTILFSDIRGFTTISENFKDDPQGLTKLINRYLTPMTQIVMESGGTIDKYIGDALMAFWNAPIVEDTTSHRIRAIESAIEMYIKLAELNAHLRKENKHPLQIGIGINTGRVVVGNMGSDQRFDYTCLGDAVNLAARLEGQTKIYGVDILLGEETIKPITDKFKFIELDKIAVKGKNEGITIYTVLSSEFNYIKHDLFLQHYKKREWIHAKRLISSLLKEGTPLSAYYKMMDDRISTLEADDPGEDWDHVFRAKSK